MLFFFNDCFSSLNYNLRSHFLFRMRSYHQNLVVCVSGDHLSNFLVVQKLASEHCVVVPYLAEKKNLSFTLKDMGSGREPLVLPLADHACVCHPPTSTVMRPNVETIVGANSPPVAVLP